MWWLSVILVASFVACEKGADSTSPRRSPTPVASSPARVESYNELNAIAKDLRAAGVRCKLERLGVGTEGETLRDFGVCKTDDGMNLDIYLIEAQSMDAWLHLTTTFPGVVGPDWIVLAPAGDAVARRVHDALGGQLMAPQS